MTSNPYTDAVRPPRAAEGEAIVQYAGHPEDECANCAHGDSHAITRFVHELEVEANRPPHAGEPA